MHLDIAGKQDAYILVLIDQEGDLRALCEFVSAAEFAEREIPALPGVHPYRAG